MQNVLITGANFANKGAQAMLFTTVSEIRSRCPHANIYYTTREHFSVSKRFRFTALDKYTFLNAFERKAGKKKSFMFFLEATKQALRSFLKRNCGALYSDYQYIPLIDNLDLIFDVSGYNLSSAFSIDANEYYLKIIVCAHKCNIPIILLPQSFGPFDYGETRSPYIQNMRKILQYPLLIFAREKSGYELLSKKCKLKNTMLSNDLVLQNKAIHWDFICEAETMPHVDLKIASANNIAIIPNTKILDKCAHIDMYSLYSGVITALLQSHKSVYLIYHSAEDYVICKNIKREFISESSVILMPQELNCYDYTNIITRFDYIIASRFHSIVHAFKQNIPCLGLGWADKYTELFESLGQQDYILDMRNEITLENILTCLKSLDHNYMSEKRVIENRLKDLQRHNCFDLIFEKLQNRESIYEA